MMLSPCFALVSVFPFILQAYGYVHNKRLTPESLPLNRRAPSNQTLSGITSVTLSSDSQSYYAVLKAGASYFRVAIDTASADLWLMSSKCADEACKAAPKYPLAYQSGTFGTVNDNQTTFSTSYSDGTVAQGIVGRETIILANLTVADQVFGVVDSTNVSMTDDMSGVLGLGFPRLSSISDSVDSSTPFFVQLAQQGRMEYPLFGLSLSRNASGSLTLGAIDSYVVEDVNDIVWHPVVEFSPSGSESNASSYLQWVTPIASIGVNGSLMWPTPTYPEITNNASLAMFDVGTNGIFGPYADVSRIFDQFNGARLVDTTQGLWAVPCDSLQPMSFTFGEQTIILLPSDYLIGRVSGNPSLCLSWPAATSPGSDGIDWQFGSPFLRAVYSVFSYGINEKEPPLIGFYTLPNVTANETEVDISSHLSSMSATVTFTLPNSLLSTPTDSTLPYLFNTSVNAPTGGIVSSELATSTYSPIFAPDATNVSALPTIEALTVTQTLIVTDTKGVVSTITSTAISAAVTLGDPPGWESPSGTTCLRVPVALMFAILSIPLVHWTELGYIM